MGACATKLRGAELESDMAPPMEVSEKKIEEVKVDEETKIEETKERRSLSNLFQEKEEVKESEILKEFDTPKQVEEEKPKIDYPALTVASSETVEAEEAPAVAAKVEESVVATEEAKKEETKPEVVVLEKEETHLPVPSSTEAPVAEK